MKKKKFGFTMAEVLIAIAIIGVIAALVLPVMMKNYNNRIFATKARRAYTAVVDACSHGLSDDQVKYPGDIINSYCEYIPGKSCTTGENGSITLKDGTVLTLTGWGNNPGGDLDVTIDTNDTKGPNADGKDRWVTKLTRDCKLADDGTAGTISFLKANNWKIPEKEPISMVSKCSFLNGLAVCNSGDGKTEYCKNWADKSTCQTFDGECVLIKGTGYMSCPSGDNQKIFYLGTGRQTATLPKIEDCQLEKAFGSMVACQVGEWTRFYNLESEYYTSYKGHCTPVSRNAVSCPDGDNQKIHYSNSTYATVPKDCTTILEGYMSCPTEGNNQKIYNVSGNYYIDVPSNCQIIGSYYSCPYGENQQKVYTMNGNSYIYPSNYTFLGSYMTYFDGTQTKVYDSYGLRSTRPGDCGKDSTGLYVCTNGNKKTYYNDIYSFASGIEVDADCADPLCSNKQ